MANTNQKPIRPQPQLSAAQQRSMNIMFRIIIITLALIAAIYAFDTYDTADSDVAHPSSASRSLPQNDMTPSDNKPIIPHL